MYMRFIKLCPLLHSHECLPNLLFFFSYTILAMLFILQRSFSQIKLLPQGRSSGMFSHLSISHQCFLSVCLFKENPYPSVAMHKLQRPSEINGQSSSKKCSPFPLIDDVAVELFIDHAAAKLKTAPPVVKAEVKSMVPSGPLLGELGGILTSDLHIV